ncbi:MAG TPA: hypothetical protein VKF63_12660 [Terracidiphilus sp.]|nr:hypothetical protein [Terracidiphilus sp.]
MNKTIYIRDEDEPTWDRARELTGAKGVSSVIVEGLKDFILKKEAEEAEAKGFQRITVKFNDAEAHHIPRIKAFHGKWIIPLTKPEKVESEDGYRRWSYSVAITAKGAAVVYWVEEEADTRGQYFRIYPSLEFAAADPRVNWAARIAIEALGVPVEELDI